MEVVRKDASIKAVLIRSIRLRCPQCGIGRLYSRWITVNDHCSVCDCDLQKRDGDCWFVFYMSTTFLTGVVVVLVFFIPVTNPLLGYGVVGLGWLVCIISTHPYRKSLAIGIDYLIDAQEM